ncbi:MAG: hypothetical protein R2711_09910 [Acidimicrobiales bacterium]
MGQAELKDHLSIILEAARRRGQAADLLFAGPPRLSKTTSPGSSPPRWAPSCT